jgi:hypothetical protein
MCVYIRGTAWETEFDQRSEGSQRLDDLGSTEIRDRKRGRSSESSMEKQTTRRRSERDRERDVGEHGLERQD